MYSPSADIPTHTHTLALSFSLSLASKRAPTHTYTGHTVAAFSSPFLNRARNWTEMRVWVIASVHVCPGKKADSVCVCVRERERERESDFTSPLSPKRASFLSFLAHESENIALLPYIRVPLFSLSLFLLQLLSDTWMKKHPCSIKDHGTIFLLAIKLFSFNNRTEKSDLQSKGFLLNIWRWYWKASNHPTTVIIVLPFIPSKQACRNFSLFDFGWDSWTATTDVSWKWGVSILTWSWLAQRTVIQ